MSATAFCPCSLLLPRPGTDLTRWAVVACDQFTSEPAYWQRVESFVGSAPSTLRLMLPEVWLSESSRRIGAIHQAMRAAMSDGTLRPLPPGWLLLRRTTAAGSRLGLLGCVDLEQYSFDRGSDAAIRPTEETVASRLPPRIAIRAGAPLEMSHVLLLADDPQRRLIEPLYARRESFTQLYDTELMEGGGHMTAWFIPAGADSGIQDALDQLQSSHGGLLMAVGDGNHSLATAKACWKRIRTGLTPEEVAVHPARWAMAEAVNIHDPALTFEPIHRLITGVDPQAFRRDLSAVARPAEEEADFVLLAAGSREPLRLADSTAPLPVMTVQAWLDGWLAAHPEAAVDYVHGEQAMEDLCRRGDAAGLLLPSLRKEAFFSLLSRLGVMPRKTFSLGEANEKRYYLECRSLLPQREAAMP